MCSSSRAPPRESPSDEEQMCWICYEGHTNENPLVKDCRCMQAHRGCRARWQLQSAGKPEETKCRFCGENLPDWRSCWQTMPTAHPVMTVRTGAGGISEAGAVVAPIRQGPRTTQNELEKDLYRDVGVVAHAFEVVHEGRNYQVTVQPGTEGKAKFEQTIREIFGLSDKDAISLTFGCALPTPPSSSPTPLGGDITLSGWESFDAAVFCASLSAGQRLSRKAAQAAQAASMGPGSGAGPSTPCSSPLRRGIMGDMLRRMFAG